MSPRTSGPSPSRALRRVRSFSREPMARSRNSNTFDSSRRSSTGSRSTSPGPAIPAIWDTRSGSSANGPRRCGTPSWRRGAAMISPGRHARSRHRADRGGAHPGGGRIHALAEGDHRRANVLAVGAEPGLDRCERQGSVHREEGAARGRATRSRAADGRSRNRLADGGTFLLGHGVATAAAGRTLAGEGAALLRVPSDRLGHERLLVAAVEAVHRARDRRLPVFAARHAHRDRSGRRVGTTPGARDGGRATVLRAGAKESLSRAAIPLSSRRLPTSSMASTDAIIVGGGHNGLVAAAYLAKAGLKVLVLERRAIVGGACVTEETHPGFRASTLAYTCGLLRPEIKADLDLPAFGLDEHVHDPSVFQPFPDGRFLLYRNDEESNRKQIAKFSEKDAAAWARYTHFWDEFAELVEPTLLAPPVS